MGHIKNTIKEKFKQLTESVKDEEASVRRDDDYQELIKFVVAECNKLVEHDPNNIKKLRFFKNLLEFINV